MRLSFSNPTIFFSFPEWLKNRFCHFQVYYWELTGSRLDQKDYQQHFNRAFKESLLSTYHPDDYDLADPKQKSFAFNAFSFLSIFFGLPNRFDEAGKITGKQILKNFIGGWEWNDDTPLSKQVLQVLGLVFGIKSIIIPAFKLASILIKPLINILKIFTEFLPLLITNSTAMGMALLQVRLERSRWSTENAVSKSTAVLGLIFLGLIHYVFKYVHLLGRALTSPENSAKIAYRAGCELKGRAGKVFGILGASLSIALSMVLWGTLLPFTIHLIPLKVFTWISHLPTVGPIFSAVKSALVAVGNFFGPIFTPILKSASHLLSTQIPLVVASIGSGLGVLGPLIGTFINVLADKLSRLWRSQFKCEPMDFQPRTPKAATAAESSPSQDDLSKPKTFPVSSSGYGFFPIKDSPPLKSSSSIKVNKSTRVQKRLF